MFSLEDRLEKDVNERDRERVRDRVRERERDLDLLLDFSTFFTGMVGTVSAAALVVSIATGIVKYLIVMSNYSLKTLIKQIKEF